MVFIETTTNLFLLPKGIIFSFSQANETCLDMILINFAKSKYNVLFEVIFLFVKPLKLTLQWLFY